MLNIGCQSFDTVGPLFQGFPDSLRETGYRDISSNTSTVFQKVWETKDPGFVWLQHNAEKFSHFNKWMQVQREGIPDWLSQYPIEQETKGWRAEDPLFVDVGGGLGHQCAGLRERYPNIPGRVILQDVPQALAQAVPLENVEMMAHDFFQPQPVKGLFKAVKFPSSGTDRFYRSEVLLSPQHSSRLPR